MLFDDAIVWAMIFEKHLVSAFNPIYQKVLSVTIGLDISIALDNLFKYIGGMIRRERPRKELSTKVASAAPFCRHIGRILAEFTQGHIIRIIREPTKISAWKLCVYQKCQMCAGKPFSNPVQDLSISSVCALRVVQSDWIPTVETLGLTSPSQKLLVAVIGC